MKPRGKSLKGRAREELLRRFREKLATEGHTMADFARSRGIRLNVFYSKLYDNVTGLCGETRDAIIDYLK